MQNLSHSKQPLPSDKSLHLWMCAPLSPTSPVKSPASLLPLQILMSSSFSTSLIPSYSTDCPRWTYFIIHFQMISDLPWSCHQWSFIRLGLPNSLKRLLILVHSVTPFILLLLHSFKHTYLQVDAPNLCNIIPLWWNLSCFKIFITLPSPKMIGSPIETVHLTSYISMVQ